ncbi:MAG: SRPBCC domain-containing protein [Chloroflexi bacterium]|nr:SRPBCC domain-containing protein [Chloroflexota bacterium]
MSDRFQVSAVIPASAKRIYDAWLDGREHSAMTGGKATASAKAGSRFTAWDEYIEGRTLQLKPPRRIVQSWRTTEFPKDAPDSRLEVRLSPAKGGTRVTLVHSEVPDGQSDSYKQGWRDYYFEPMQAYFAKYGASGRRKTRR